VKPMNDNVVIRPDEAPTHSPGGIILPDEARKKERPVAGVVLAKGPGKWVEAKLDAASLRARDVGTYTLDRVKIVVGRRPVALEVGMRVLFPKYAGVWVKLDGVPVQIMPESDVLAIIDAGTEASFDT